MDAFFGKPEIAVLGYTSPRGWSILLLLLHTSVGMTAYGTNTKSAFRQEDAPEQTFRGQVGRNDGFTL